MAGSQGRSLWRWLRLALVLLALLALLIVLAPQILLPMVERTASETLRTPVEIGWIDLDVVRGRIGLRNVVAGKDDALAISRISAEPDVERLLDGTIELERIEIEGLRGTVEQNADGVPALRGLPFPEAEEGARDAGPPVAVREVVMRDIDLRAIPPKDLRPQPVSVHIDELVARTVPTTEAGQAYQGELRGSLDGVPLTANARVDQAGERWRVEAEATLTGSPVSSEHIALPRGFESLTATANGTIHYLLDPAADRERIEADLELEEVRLGGQAETSLTARRIGVAGLELRLDAGEADLGRVTVVAPRIEAALTDKGLVYPGLVPKLLEPDAKEEERGEAGAAESGWRISGGRIEAGEGHLLVRRGDQRVPLELRSFSWRGLASGASGPVAISLRLEEGGSIEVEGRLGIEPTSVDLALDLSEVALPVIAGLVDLPLGIARGTMGGEIRATGAPDALHIVATVDASQVHTAPPPGHPDRVLAVDRLETRLELDTARPGGVDIASLAFSYPYAMIQRTAAGIFPLQALSGDEGRGATAGETASEEAADERGVPEITIRRLIVTGGRLDFVDQTTTPAYWTGLAQAEIDARDVVLRPAGLDQITASGRQDELHPVRAGAQRTGAESWTGSGHVDGMSLPTLNPYLAPTLGYEATGGTLSLDVTAALVGKILHATSEVSLEDVGVRQRGLDVIQTQTGVPLDVALALLKDIGGEIEIDVPMEVDTETGELELGSFVTQAIGRAVLGALSSPLRWLGMLFGTEGPPNALAIDPIPFPPGSADLDAEGETRVTQIGRILGSHADLDLILKAQIAESDLAGRDPAGLAAARVAAVRELLTSAAGGGFAAERIVVAPWSPPADGAYDTAPGVYAELRSR